MNLKQRKQAYLEEQWTRTSISRVNEIKSGSYLGSAVHGTDSMLSVLGQLSTTKAYLWLAVSSLSCK